MALRYAADYGLSGRLTVSPSIPATRFERTILPAHTDETTITRQAMKDGTVLLAGPNPNYVSAVELDLDTRDGNVPHQLNSLAKKVNDAGSRLTGHLRLSNGAFTATLVPDETERQGYTLIREGAEHEHWPPMISPADQGVEAVVRALRCAGIEWPQIRVARSSTEPDQVHIEYDPLPLADLLLPPERPDTLSVLRDAGWTSAVQCGDFIVLPDMPPAGTPRHTYTVTTSHTFTGMRTSNAAAYAAGILQETPASSDRTVTDSAGRRRVIPGGEAYPDDPAF